MPIYPDADEQQQITKKIIRGVASYKQILGGKVIVDYLNYVAPVIPFKITSITKPAVGTYSITGDTSCQLERTSRYDEDTFTVYYSNFDRSKYSKIKVSYSIVFSTVMSAVYALSKVTFNGSTEVAQSQYYSETKTGTFNITPSSSSGSFTVKIKNGLSQSSTNTTVTVNLTITPA
jgi:hypothetical protein